ncbi:MAG: ABC transporter ATP-binding protein [Chloroflexi bacterium]|nr:ABC transporter ATP-binding protein [Chloroflexota bacterium]
MTEHALELDGVTRSFGGLVAVADVSLRVSTGERRAIIGPNGAGKTTLFRLISGETAVSRGRITLFGTDITRLAAHARVARGLGRTYQVTNVFPNLSVQDNVMLAALGQSATKFQPVLPVSRRGQQHQQVQAALSQVGLQQRSAEQVARLSHGEQRQLELALALVGRPRVLLLDEPAAGLSSAERASMAELVRRLPRELTLIIIEHDMDLVLNLVDRVTCLHEGRIVAEETPATIRDNRMVQDIYLGSATAVG